VEVIAFIHYCITVLKRRKDLWSKTFKESWQQDDLFEFVRAKLFACPYQWLRAYQNGGAVISYVKMRIEGDGNNGQGTLLE